MLKVFFQSNESFKRPSVERIRKKKIMERRDKKRSRATASEISEPSVPERCRPAAGDGKWSEIRESTEIPRSLTGQRSLI